MKSNKLGARMAWLLAGCMAATAVAHAQTERETKIIQTHCASCHTFGKGEPNGAGPNLYGLIGKAGASVSGYTYSPNLAQALKGKVWTKEFLDTWLTDTEAATPGIGMTYFQDDPSIRAAIIKYISDSR